MSCAFRTRLVYAVMGLKGCLHISVRVQIISELFLGVCVVWLVMYNMTGWHVLRYPYSWESDQWASGFWLFPLSRVPAIALNMVASLAFLTLMPASENILRRAGERSLCPYVCHLLMLMFLHVNTDLVEDLEWKHVVPTFLVMGGWTLFLFLPITYDFLLNTLIPPLNKSRFVFSDKTA